MLITNVLKKKKPGFLDYAPYIHLASADPLLCRTQWLTGGFGVTSTDIFYQGFLDRQMVILMKHFPNSSLFFKEKKQRTL